MESEQVLPGEYLFTNGKVSDNFPFPLKTVGFDEEEEGDQVNKPSSLLFEQYAKV